MEKKKNDVWERISTLFCLAFVVWLVWSWLDVVAHNRTDYVYSNCNLLILMFKICNIKGV